MRTDPIGSDHRIIRIRRDCVARQTAAKAAYELWVAAAEQEALQRALTTCPDRHHCLPGAQDHHPGHLDLGARAPAPKTQSPQQTGTDPDFGICKAAGPGPYVRGVDPECALVPRRRQQQHRMRMTVAPVPSARR